MFTYLVLPFGSAPFLCEKMLILCTSYALRNGLFVLFRTVLYIDVHRGLGHGLGQNAFSKIWLNFLARKVQEKAPKSSDFGVFYGGQYRTRTCDPMHVKHVLIPAELTVHQRGYYTRSRCVCQALFFRYHAISRSAASP